jgi:hypothetical protein
MIKTLVRERVLKATWRWTPPRGFLTSFGKLASSLGTESGLGHDPKSSGRFRSCPAPDLLFVYWLSVLPLTDRFPIRK